MQSPQRGRAARRGLGRMLGRAWKDAGGGRRDGREGRTRGRHVMGKGRVEMRRERGEQSPRKYIGLWRSREDRFIYYYF